MNWSINFRKYWVIHRPTVVAQTHPPDGELWEFHHPVQASLGVSGAKIKQVQDALTSWIAANVAALPVNGARDFTLGSAMRWLVVAAGRFCQPRHLPSSTKGIRRRLGWFAVSKRQSEMEDQLRVPSSTILLAVWRVSCHRGQSRYLIDKLLPFLGDGGADVRAAAAKALGKIRAGDRTDAVIDKLLPFFGDEDYDVRHAATRKSCRAGGWRPSGWVVPQAAPSPRRSEQRGAQSPAVEVIGQITTSDRAGVAIDRLLLLLTIKTKFVRGSAAEALGKLATGIRSGEVVDKLLPLLDHGNVQTLSSVEYSVAEALGELPLGDRAGEALDKLMPLLDHGDTRAMKSVARALGNIPAGNREAAVVNKLLPLLAIETPMCRMRRQKP